MKPTIALTFLLLLSTTLSAQTRYDGNWILDQDASIGMAQQVKDRVAEWLLDVKQDGDKLAVAVTIRHRDEKLETMVTNLVYRLDGKESANELTVRTPDGTRKIPAASVTKVEADGALTIETSSELPFNGEVIKRVNRERWTLSADGKTLSVQRKDDTPRGLVEWTMVFRRK